MISMIAEPEPVILKIDGRGRVRTPVDQREGLLDAFERSGLSGMKFAALHGVKYPSFANWVQQRKRRRLAAVAGSGDGAGRSPEARLAGSSSGSGHPFQWWEAVVGREAAVGLRAPEGTGSCGLKLHLPDGVCMEITAGEQVVWAALLLRALSPNAPPRSPNLQPLPSC